MTPREGESMRIDDTLTVAVDGHLERVTKPALEALDLLWQVVRRLPQDDYQLRAMERLLGSRSTADLEQMMRGEGAVDFALAVDGGGRVIVRVWHGDGLTAAQRVGARYTPECYNEPLWHGGPTPWAIRDRHTGGFVMENGRPIFFSTEADADAWRRRQVQLASYRTGPARLAAQ